MHFVPVKKSQKLPGFAIYSPTYDTVLTVVKGGMIFQ